ncbi:hypothetical protein Q8A73_000103 [Channa argus]|nr:hypothetical protein Q8A73_000103 [Channa argus]
MHTDASLSTREDKKLQMILDSNSTKGGADNLVTATYSCQQLGKSLVTPKIQRRARPARSLAAAAVIEKVKFVPSNQSAMDPMDTGVKKWNRYQNCPSQKDNVKLGDSGLYYCDGKPAAYLNVTKAVGPSTFSMTPFSATESPYSLISGTVVDGNNKGQTELNYSTYVLLDKPQTPANNHDHL